MTASRAAAGSAGGRRAVPLASGLAPISAAVVAGGFAFLSGFVALDPATGLARGATVTTQARDVLAQIQTVLAGLGAALGDVVRCVCYLTDAAHAGELDGVFREVFPAAPPARSTLVCGLVRPGLLVEVEATACLP